MRIYRAAFIPEWQRNTVRLMLMEPAGPGENRVLMSDGTWAVSPETGSLEGAGIVLPAGAIEEIAKAIAEHQGHTSHADTEARVLREWLAVERGRVDALVGKVLVHE